MNKQVISMMNNGKAVTVEELSELLVSGLSNGTFTGNEIMADFDNSDCCMMGLKKKTTVVMSFLLADTIQKWVAILLERILLIIC